MFLDEIRAHKERELAERKRLRPPGEMEKRISSLGATRDFTGALRCADGVALIAEIKRASPSKGLLRAELDPGELARAYEAAGAVAISVLTEEKFFRGSLDDLRRARAAVSLPILRKDFALDRYHLLEAREAGADAILLIVRMLSRDELRALMREAQLLGLHPLVEVHDEAELARALEVGAEVIGINNRDLDTLGVDLETTFRLTRSIPKGKVIVAESGIRAPEDVQRLAEAGIHAVLVGEALVTQPDPGEAARDLVLAGRRKPLPSRSDRR